MRCGILHAHFDSRERRVRRNAPYFQSCGRPEDLELQLKVDARAEALEFLPAQPGVEALEAENEIVVQPVIDPEINSARYSQGRPPERKCSGGTLSQHDGKASGYCDN